MQNRFLQGKILFYLGCLWLISLLAIEIWYRMEKNYASTSWDNYRNKQLLYTSQAIQENFYEMERLSFSILDELLSKTSILQEITYSSPSEASLRIFQALNGFAFPMDLNRRGIAVYDHLRQCIAWKNCDFNPAPHLLEECLKGERFSTIVKSGRGVFVVLCTFIPIPHPKLREYVGVAVCFLPLDSNYPLSTRYIKSQSFAKKMLQEYDVQDISINYENFFSPMSISQNSLQRPLQNINGQQLGSLLLTALPQETTLNALEKNRMQWLQVSSSIFAILVCAFFWYGLSIFPIVGWKKNFAILLMLYILRQILFSLQFPNQILPSFFSSPQVFHSYILGEWSDSLGNLFVSCFMIFLASIVCLKTIFSLPERKSFLFLIRILLVFVFPLFLAWGNGALYNVVYALAKYSSFPLFDFNNLLPGYDALILYLCTLFLGFSFLFFALFLWELWRKSQNSNNFLGIFVFFGISCFLLFWGEFPRLCLWSSLFFFLTIMLYILRFPKRYELFCILVLACVSLALYPFLQDASKIKSRALIEDKSLEIQESSIKNTLDVALDTIENSVELLRSLEQKKSDIAFLLWAETPLSERLDNLELLVYSKIDKAKENTSFSESFQIFSQFSLNMPNPLWYRPLLQKIQYGSRQLLTHLPGFDNEGKNMLFYLAALPVYSDKKEILGYVVLFTRHPQLARSLSVPEVFAKKPALASTPLLMASFEKQTMFLSNNPYVSKNFKPLPGVIQEVQEKAKNLWIKESIENRLYDNFYFLWTSQEWVESKKEWVEQKTIGMIGYPLPSQITKIFHLLQFFLSGFVFFLFPLFFSKIFYHFIKQGIRLRFSFEYKLLLSFLLISGIPVFIMGVLSKEKAISQIWENYERNLTESLENAEKAMREETYVPLAADEINSKMPDDAFCRSWGERNRSMLNVYLSSQPFLLATNRRELFYTELLPTRISGNIYYQLMLERKEIYITLESIADYTFVVGYKALFSALDKREIVGVISIPMIYRQAEVKREMAEMMATVFTIYILVFLLVMVIGIILAHQITRPLAHLMTAIHRVSRGDLDIALPVSSKDEFGELVDSFNRMTKDLKMSREKLVQAEKDAAWREMARQIAHEIKNPLTPMKLSAQHIQRAYKDQAKNFDKILDKGISNIIDAIDSLSKTASSFSEFARFIKPSLAAYSLDPLIADCMELFNNYAEQNIFLRSEIEKNLPKVITDPHHLKRVLFNLLTNAVQAIKNTPGEIVLTCRKDLKDPDKVLITIQDNGSGISDNIKHHLFEPNFSTKTHGSGLGLAICKRAIDHMGGEIFIESEEGKGTLVSIKLKTSVCL